MPSDALVDLKAQLTEAIKAAYATWFSDGASPAATLSGAYVEAAWPLVESALAAERQAGRLQGRQEAAEAIRTAAATQSSEGEYGYGALVALRRAGSLALGPSPEPEQQQ